MNYSDIISVEKAHFSDIHSEFNHFINLLKYSDQLSEDALQSIIIVNKKMQG